MTTITHQSFDDGTLSRWSRTTEKRASSAVTDVLEIRHYYLWGSKKVPYGSIKGVQRVALSALKGRARIWGTANMGYWANLDTKRPSKKEGLVLDLGKRVKPFITPDDPDRVEADSARTSRSRRTASGTDDHRTVDVRTRASTSSTAANELREWESGRRDLAIGRVDVRLHRLRRLQAVLKLGLRRSQVLGELGNRRATEEKDGQAR